MKHNQVGGGHGSKSLETPKGKDLMVYNGTTLGLNSALWAPLFYMPSTSTNVLLHLVHGLRLGRDVFKFPAGPQDAAVCGCGSHASIQILGHPTTNG